jgi:hypothetical protein
VKRRKRLALGLVLLIATAMLAIPAIVFAGQGSSTPLRSDRAKHGPAASSVEDVRLERRESSRRTGCSQRTELRADPGL